jgi:hypothetical protein
MGCEYSREPRHTDRSHGRSHGRGLLARTVALWLPSELKNPFASGILPAAANSSPSNYALSRTPPHLLSQWRVPACVTAKINNLTMSLRPQGTLASLQDRLWLITPSCERSEWIDYTGCHRDFGRLTNLRIKFFAIQPFRGSDHRGVPIRYLKPLLNTHSFLE